MPSSLGVLSLENMKVVTSEQKFSLIPLKTYRVFIVLGFELVVSPRHPAHLGYLPSAGFCNQTIALGVAGCLNDVFIQAGGRV